MKVVSLHDMMIISIDTRMILILFFALSKGVVEIDLVFCVSSLNFGELSYAGLYIRLCSCMPYVGLRQWIFWLKSAWGKERCSMSPDSFPSKTKTNHI